MLVLAAGTYQALPTNVQITPDTPLDSLTLDEVGDIGCNWGGGGILLQNWST